MSNEYYMLKIEGYLLEKIKEARKLREELNNAIKKDGDDYYEKLKKVHTEEDCIGYMIVNEIEKLPF